VAPVLELSYTYEQRFLGSATTHWGEKAGDVRIA